VAARLAASSYVRFLAYVLLSEVLWGLYGLKVALEVAL